MLIWYDTILISIMVIYAFCSKREALVHGVNTVLGSFRLGFSIFFVGRESGGERKLRCSTAYCFWAMGFVFSGEEGSILLGYVENGIGV